MVPAAYSGLLEVIDGRSAQGVYAMVFSVYDDVSAGNHVFEQSESVEVRDGLFYTLLQANELARGLPFDELVFVHCLEGQRLFLEIEVAGEILTPRQPIAIDGCHDTLRELDCRKGQVPKLGTRGWACAEDELGAVLADKSVTVPKLAADVILRIDDALNVIPNDSVTNAALQAGAVTLRKLGPDVQAVLTDLGGLIVADRIADGAVQARHIAAGQVKAAHLESGAVTAAKIGQRQIESGHLAPGLRAAMGGALLPADPATSLAVKAGLRLEAGQSQIQATLQYRAGACQEGELALATQYGASTCGVNAPCNAFANGTSCTSPSGWRSGSASGGDYPQCRYLDCFLATPLPMSQPCFSQTIGTVCIGGQP
jgi:hypothetical protein